MDKRTARIIADGLAWSRVWLALPITVLGTIGKLQLAWYVASYEAPPTADGENA